MSRLENPVGLDFASVETKPVRFDAFPRDIDPAEWRRINSLIVTRAFAYGSHRRRKSAINREILIFTIGGIVSLILMTVLIYAIQLV